MRREQQKQDEKLLKEKLPSYFFNQNSRAGAETIHYTTLRDLNSTNVQFMKSVSSLNTKKEFRVDPETQQPVGKRHSAKTRKLIATSLNKGVGPTFIQLLTKHGYVIDEAAQKPR